MVRSSLEAEGFAYYVEELRRGSTDPYLAYRIYERSWNVPRKDAALMRGAVIRLIEADPWFLATGSPHFLDSLRTRDLERLTDFVGAGPARKAAAMLRATLWYYGRRGPYHVDRIGRVQLRRALGFLQRVPRSQRDAKWHEMLVGCYRVLDYARYKRAFPSLVGATAPEWRASILHDFLGVVASKKDWRTYDRARPQWDQLPPEHHACECYYNELHTDDGLRAAAAGHWDAIPDALTKAASVRGCPHLNTGGMRLGLVELLLSKKRHLGAARDYLARAAQFGGGARVAKVQRRLDQIDKGAW